MEISRIEYMMILSMSMANIAIKIPVTSYSISVTDEVLNVPGTSMDPDEIFTADFNVFIFSFSDG